MGKNSEQASLFLETDRILQILVSTTKVVISQAMPVKVQMGTRTSKVEMGSWKTVKCEQATININFDFERPGCRFSAQLRLAAVFYKGLLYGSVGFGCGIIGQGIANMIMNAKRRCHS